MTAEQKAARDEWKAEKAIINARLAAEARAYSDQWCNPAAYRAYLRRFLTRTIAEMREQRLARIKRHDAMLDWLRAYELWREENGRPIAYVGVVPQRAAEAA